MGLRLKPGHSLDRLMNGAIWIGPSLHGLATELVDESGVLWSICARLDGTRSRELLVQEVLGSEPARAADCGVNDVTEMVDFLIGSGWLLDPDAPVPPELSPHEVTRYRRNAEFFSSIDLRPDMTGYRLQARLKASRVVVLGLGGVGCAVAASLAGCGVGWLHCVDHDVVELSNLNRQLLYTERDLGRSKVAACVAELRSRNTAITITGSDVLLDGPDAITAAITGCDAFLLCADMPLGDIRHWANDAAYMCGVPMLMAGYAGPKYSLGCFIPGQTGCYTCLWAGRMDAQQAAGLISGDPGYHQFDDNPVIAPTAQIAANFLAMETVKLLAGLPVQTAGRELHRYVVDYDQQYYLDATPRPDCRVACGAAIAR
jgi:molybdopterin/thiamine biosynthesis adenylyltransferase